MDIEAHSEVPLTPENFGQPVARGAQRKPEGDFYRWVLTPGRPLELYRRPMTCFGRTWTLETWSRKLMVSPRKLHDKLVSGMKEGRTIRSILLVDLKADMALILGGVRRKRTSSVESVQQTQNDDGGLLRERLAAIENRRRATRLAPKRLTESGARPSLSSSKPDGE